MWNVPTKERLNRIPKLYETEHIPLKEKMVHLHFFIFGSDSFVAEYDGNDLFWGFSILNGDYLNSEWGYFSFKELKELNVNCFEVDCELEDYFPVQKASEIDKICKGNGWAKPDRKRPKYSDEDIEHLMRQTVMDDVLELTCENCGSALRCEPDAKTSYCVDCGKVVPTNNPLIEMGLI